MTYNETMCALAYVAVMFSFQQFSDRLERIDASLAGWQPVMEHQRRETEEILKQKKSDPQPPKGKTDAKRK